MPADNSLMSTIVMVVLMVAAFWLLLIRPAQKKQKQQQQMVSQLGEGSRVMLSSGVFGTILHSGEKQAIVEVSPGVEMTVLKQAIVRVVEPAEEEFEYDDDSSAAVTPTDGTLVEPTVEEATVIDYGTDTAPAPEGTPDFEQPGDTEHKSN